MNRKVQTAIRGFRIVALLCIGAVFASVGVRTVSGATTVSGVGLGRKGRSLTWNDKPIHLVGYSYYGLLGDRQFDAESFLEILSAHNINFTRFFLILPWVVEPGPNVLPFSKTGDKYDLRKFNDAYFARLASIVKRAEELGVICQVCLFDRCGLSIADRRAWRNNPYNADLNVNGLLKGPEAGYPPFCQVNGAIADINAEFIKKVVETIGDRRNIIYEIMNEPYPQLGSLPKWHAWVARTLRKNLKSRLGSKVISSTGAYDDEQIDVFSMHTACQDRHVAVAIRQSEELNKPVILSNDGDRSMLNPDEMRRACERALKLGQHFEHLAYTITLQREQENRLASHLDQMPGLCRQNLRTLSERSIPYRTRPYVRRNSLTRSDAGHILSATIEHVEKARQIIGERSENGGRTWMPIAVTVNENGHGTSAALPYLKDAVNFARFVCIDQQFRRWPGPAVQFNPSGQWSAKLGENIIEAGLFRVRANSPDGTLKRVRRGDRACYETDRGRHGKYAYFRLEDSFSRGDTLQTVSITIEYYDNVAGGNLVLEYDAPGGPYTAAQAIKLQGTGTWKSATFTARDATFRGRQNDGADFRFSLQEGRRPLALRSVRVQHEEDGGKR